MRNLADAERELAAAKALLLRWNKAVTKHTPLAGSEYIDDPERTMAAVARWARLNDGVLRVKLERLTERATALQLALDAAVAALRCKWFIPQEDDCDCQPHKAMALARAIPRNL